MHPLPHVEKIQLPIEIEEKDPRIAYSDKQKTDSTLEWPY